MPSPTSDASTKTPVSGLSNDPMFHALYASYALLEGTDIPLVRRVMQNALMAGNPSLGNGGSNGFLKINGTITYGIAGIPYNKIIADDAFCLTANATLGLTTWQGFSLYLDSAGVGSVYAGATASDTAGALSALENVPAAKARVGLFLAKPGAIFTNALSGEGTIYNGSLVQFFLSSYAVSLG